MPPTTLPKPVAPADWRVAKRLPPATLPMVDCHNAANVPTPTPAEVKPTSEPTDHPKIVVTAAGIRGKTISRASVKY